MSYYTRPEPGKPILIEVAGQILELCFSLKSLKDLDVEAHISVLKGDALSPAVMQDPAKLAIVLYYGLKTMNPQVTLDWVENSFHASMLLDLSPMLAFACTGRWVDIDQVLETGPNASRPRAVSTSTGSPSGPLAVTTSVAPNPNSGA